MGEAAKLGVDVALITVQVEIVRAIDCASKCYTSHLSNLFFSSVFFFTEKHAIYNCECAFTQILELGY